tara:strand:- start:28272 stop:28652 length:381 start_codon:yes stop_codon:yes gene_type:complete
MDDIPNGTDAATWESAGIASRKVRIQLASGNGEAAIETIKEAMRASMPEVSHDPSPVHISQLPVSDRRTLETLERAGVRTVGALVCMTRADLIGIDQIGHKRIDFLREAVRKVYPGSMWLLRKRGG